MREAAPQQHAIGAPALHCRTFLALPGQARHARAFLAHLLDDCPATADATLCLGELVANAIIHSRSREPGGQFTVRAEIRHGERLRDPVPWDYQDVVGRYLRPGSRVL